MQQHHSPSAGSEQGLPPAPAASLGRSPIAALLLVVVAVGAVGAVVWSARDRREVGVLVARTDIPEFHLVTASDIVVGTRDADDAARFAAHPVEGRLTTRRLKRGAAIRDRDLVPRPSEAMSEDLVVTGLQVTRAATLNGALRSGDRVELVAAADERAPLEATVISVKRSATSGPRPDALILAMQRVDVEKHASVLASGRLTVVRAAQ